MRFRFPAVYPYCPNPSKPQGGRQAAGIHRAVARQRTYGGRFPTGPIAWRYLRFTVGGAETTRTASIRFSHLWQPPEMHGRLRQRCGRPMLSADAVHARRYRSAGEPLGGTLSAGKMKTCCAGEWSAWPAAMAILSSLFSFSARSGKLVFPRLFHFFSEIFKNVLTNK